jgi:hypothetical protein
MDALRDTNANNKLQVKVIVQKSILAAKQYATDYRDEPACTLQHALKENLPAKSLMEAVSVQIITTVKKNDSIQTSLSIHILKDCIFNNLFEFIV